MNTKCTKVSVHRSNRLQADMSPTTTECVDSGSHILYTHNKAMCIHWRTRSVFLRRPLTVGGYDHWEALAPARTYLL